MNRNQLRYFVAAAESRSFTKAAEQFYISQTAITQQMQLLEESLGCALFDRSTRPVSLTPAGKIFLGEARAILDRMSSAVERVHDASTGLTGTLRVGFVRGYERSDLSVLMRSFHLQNQNALISFYRCSTDVLAAGLMQQEYDIIFTWDSTNLKQQEGIDFLTVQKAKLVVALYAGHPFAQRRQLRREELRGENILYMSPSDADDSYGDAFFMQLYKSAGYKPNILFRSSDTESILMMVAAEEGISILPDYCTDKLYHADNLVFVPLIGDGEEEEIIAAWLKDNQNPALEHFLTDLRECPDLAQISQR
jgi:LysR family transcriptional activator of glutamate synthase operon